MDALGYDISRKKDEKELNIIKSVITISEQEEHLTFKEVYERIKKLNYYNLPPLYWNQLDKDQKIKSFAVWEDYMQYLMSQCKGNEIFKFTAEETENCIKLKKRQISEKRSLLFE